MRLVEFLILLGVLLIAIKTVNAIVGGEDAKPHSAPFLVNLKRIPGPTNSVLCGGVILTDNAILTASSCTTEETSIIITAGDHNIKIDEETEQTSEVLMVIRHPSNPYNSQHEPYNFAILFLKTKLIFNEYVQPISLPKLGQCSKGEVLAYGWGYNETLYPHDILQVVQFPILDPDICKPHIEYYGFKYDLAILCAGRLGEGKVMHIGDDGGPVIQTNEVGKPFLIGIMSKYSASHNPVHRSCSVIGNVAAATDFIEDSIKYYQ